LVLSFRPEKKEPRREGSKKTRRSASDGSPPLFFLFFLFSLPLFLRGPHYASPKSVDTA
jgi:hypothetical protein